MKLADLSPRLWAAEGRSGQGVVFRCPCCRTYWCCVAFANPLDGGAPWDIGTHERRPIRQLWALLYDGGLIPRGQQVIPPGFLWVRSGDTFETLSLSPSVDCSAAGHWHGFVRGGGIQ